MKGYTRKEISNLLKIGNETLRYYEKIRIIPVPERTESGYRVYSEEDLLRLKFITRLKELGFSLREISTISQMLSSNSNINNQILNDQLTSKMEDLDQKINALKDLKELLDYIKNNPDLAKCNLLKFLYKRS